VGLTATAVRWSSVLASLVPSLPYVLNVARRERRKPGKIYHMLDVTWRWSAARTNPDSALFDATANDRRSECINDCSANKSSLLNVEPTWATFGRISVLGTMSVHELTE
jgi:hypothetical protein